MASGVTLPDSIVAGDSDAARHPHSRDRRARGHAPRGRRRRRAAARARCRFGTPPSASTSSTSTIASGLYPQKSLPAGLGREAAGVVTAVGKKVRGFRVGDRVAYVHTVPGSYCELRNVPAAPLVKIPAGVSDEQAAVLMLKGMTACYLLRHTLPREARRRHRGARRRGRRRVCCCRNGAKKLGATVIGVVGSDEKAQLAKKNGCKHVLVRGRDDDRRVGEEAHQGRRRARGVRRRRQGHVLRIARLPAQARDTW